MTMFWTPGASWWKRPWCWLLGHAPGRPHPCVELLDLELVRRFTGQSCERCGYLIEVVPEVSL